MINFEESGLPGSFFNFMEIPLKILEIDQMGYHVIIEGMINKLKANVLIDSGASRTVIDLNRLNYFLDNPLTHAYDKSVAGVGSGQITSYLPRIPRLQLGLSILEDLEVVAIDLNAINRNYALYDLPHIDMVLGSDLLLQLGACIDYGERKLTFKN